jgi:hypothetical protein
VVGGVVVGVAVVDVVVGAVEVVVGGDELADVDGGGAEVVWAVVGETGVLAPGPCDEVVVSSLTALEAGAVT